MSLIELNNTIVELDQILSQINILLPQLSEFLNQFNNIIAENNINVVTDSVGNMSIDAPNSMSDEQTQFVSKKVGVVDRLINTRGEQINQLLEEGMKKDNALKSANPKHHSVILEKLAEFNRLKDSYKH
jgi:ABC-type transporter Mla subunit MlaD